MRCGASPESAPPLGISVGVHMAAFWRRRDETDEFDQDVEPPPSAPLDTHARDLSRLTEMFESTGDLDDEEQPRRVAAHASLGSEFDRILAGLVPERSPEIAGPSEAPTMRTAAADRAGGAAVGEVAGSPAAGPDAATVAVPDVATAAGPDAATAGALDATAGDAWSLTEVVEGTGSSPDAEGTTHATAMEWGDDLAVSTGALDEIAVTGEDSDVEPGDGVAASRPVAARGDVSAGDDRGRAVGEPATQTRNTNKGESMINVDVSKLESACTFIEDTLRGGLLAMDIWDTESGLSLAGINSNPAATALFNQLTGDLEGTLLGSGFPGLNRYYLLDLKDDKIVVVLRQDGDFLGGMLLDATKTNLGMLVGVVIPRTLESMTAARHG